MLDLLEIILYITNVAIIILFLFFWLESCIGEEKKTITYLLEIPQDIYSDLRKKKRWTILTKFLASILIFVFLGFGWLTLVLVFGASSILAGVISIKYIRRLFIKEKDEV